MSDPSPTAPSPTWRARGRWWTRLHHLADAPVLDSRAATRLYRLSTVCATLGAIIGCTALLGFATRTPLLVRVFPGLPPMYPNTAIGLAAVGAALLVARLSAAGSKVAMAVVAVVVAGATAEFVLNVIEADRTWLEGLFPQDFLHATTVVPGRPVAETCLSMILLGGSVLLLHMRRAAQLGQLLGLAAASVGLSAVVGYALDPSGTSLRENSVLVGMALPTGVGIMLLGIAATTCRPHVGFVHQLLGAGIAGAMTRRMAGIIAAAPLALLLLGVVVYQLAPTTEFAQAVFSVLQVATFGALILVPASLVTATEAELREQLVTVRRDAEAADDVATLVAAIGADAIATPSLSGWESAVHFSPAWGHLGGDALLQLGGDSRTLLIAIDIAGHDARAAVLAYGVRAHVAALHERGASLEAIVASTNAKLIRRGTIATGVFIEVGAGGEQLRIVNAGHPPPLLVQGRKVLRVERTRPLLGIPADSEPPFEWTAAAGDLLVVYTDGLEEARPSGGEGLGDGVERAITTRREEPVETIADGAVDAARQHAGGRLADDVLVLVLRRT